MNNKKLLAILFSFFISLNFNLYSMKTDIDEQKFQFTNSTYDEIDKITILLNKKFDETNDLWQNEKKILNISPEEEKNYLSYAVILHNSEIMTKTPLSSISSQNPFIQTTLKVCTFLKKDIFTNDLFQNSNSSAIDEIKKYIVNNIQCSNKKALNTYKNNLREASNTDIAKIYFTSKYQFDALL
jgi:hypothetical protein